VVLEFQLLLRLSFVNLAQDLQPNLLKRNTKEESLRLFFGLIENQVKDFAVRTGPISESKLLLFLQELLLSWGLLGLLS